MYLTATKALLTALSASSSITVMERSFLCSDGMKLAAQHWKNEPDSKATNANQRILCLHGWLDNCRSFHYLAPRVMSKLNIENENNHMDHTPPLSSATEIVALDFPGHGMSSHKSPDSFQLMTDYVFYVSECVAQLGWESFVLVGHSMGAGVGVLYAASFPELVHRLVLLDGAGPLPRKAHSVAKYARTAILKRQAGNQIMYNYNNNIKNKIYKGSRVYPNIELAVDTRCATATRMPGRQTISLQASFEIVQRGTIKVGDQGEVQFRHDPRLQWPSMQYVTEEQIEGLYNDLSCPICVLRAQDGWPMDEEEMTRIQTLLQPEEFQILPGSHHFHADPETADAVSDAIVAFLR